jgi:hypothetical protein
MAYELRTADKLRIWKCSCVRWLNGRSMALAHLFALPTSLLRATKRQLVMQNVRHGHKIEEEK